MTKYDTCKYVLAGGSVFLFVISLVIFACNVEAKSSLKSIQAVPDIDRATYSRLSGHYLAARFAFGQNDISSAANYYRRALTQDPENAILVQRALALGLQEGQVLDSLPLANRLVGLSPKSKIGHLSLLIEAFSRKNHKKALYHLDQLGREGMFEFVTPLLQGWLLLANGDLEAAQIAVDSLKDNQSFKIYHAYHSALMADVVGNDKDAEKYFKIAFNGIPGGTLRVTLGYSLFLKNSGRLEESLSVIEMHKRYNPDSGWIVAIGDVIKAPRPLKHIVSSIGEGLAEVLLGAASALPNQSAGGMGLTYAQLALYLRPESPVIQFLIGESFDSIGRYEEAITAYRKVAPNSPYYWPSRLRAAASLANVDRRKEAVKNLEEMVSQKVDRADAAIALADLLRSNTRYKEALKYYDIAISRIANFEAKHWALFYSRGTVFERIKEWPKAEADFFYALKLEPDQPLVLNYLGYSWVEQGNNLENAMRFIEKAVALRPMDGYIVDSLGWAFYRLGKFDAAVKHLERASELQAGDPVIADHLGDIYWALGRRNEAKFQWERSLVLGADEQVIELINKKLLEGIPSVR